MQSLSTTRRDIRERIDVLRRRVAMGEARAKYEVGRELLEGIQDRRGRTIVRRNPQYAFRLLLTATNGGVKDTFGPLAYAYDLGFWIWDLAHRPTSGRRCAGIDARIA
jgi:hypothetical protein